MSAEGLDAIGAAVRGALDAHLALLDLLHHPPGLSFLPDESEWPAVLAAAIVWARRNDMHMVERGRTEKNEIHVVEVRDRKPGVGRAEPQWREVLIATIHVPDELVGSDALG